MSFELIAVFGAAWATVWNVLACTRAPLPWRRLYFLMACFSLLYIVGWGWLVVDPELDRAVWSKTITPLSVASFFVVWAGHAVVSFFTHDPDKQTHGVTIGKE